MEQAEAQREVEQAARPSDGVGAGLYHQAEGPAGAGPGLEPTAPANNEDSIEDQLKQQLEHLKQLQANLM